MELFEQEKFLTKEAKADKALSKAYTEMTSEVERVANEEVTIWARLTSWIYSKIFHDATHKKEKQSMEEKYISAKAFTKVQNVFKPVADDSMTNEDIMNHAQRKFKK